MKRLLVLSLLLGGCLLTEMEPLHETVPLPVERIELLSYREGELYVRTYGHAPDPCTQYDRTEIKTEKRTLSIQNVGKREKDVFCAQVLTPYTADVRLSLPEPGTYRLIFWPGTVDTSVTLPIASR